MYNPAFIKPMREELTKIGVKELLTPEEVDQFISNSSGSQLIFVNSMCGCAAGGARPGLAMALENEKKPAAIATVFAGQDADATQKARSYFHGYQPSSPSAALLKDGKVVFMLERTDIEGYSAAEIADKLKTAFNQYC